MTEKVDPNATVIWGARIDPAMEGKIEVIAIFTGIQSPYMLGKTKHGDSLPSGKGKSFGPSGHVDEIQFI